MENEKIIFNKETEKIDDLMVNNLKIIQKKSGFKFGIDAVLLSYFAANNSNAQSVLDLGTGTGIIPILLAGKYGFNSVKALEIQKKYVEMAKRSVLMNKLEDKINIIEGDIKNIKNLIKGQSIDLVVSNPPYKNNGSGIINECYDKTIARHEVLCSFEQLIAAVKYVLKPNGSFILVHRPDRLVDIFWIMRKYRIEPKLIRMVYGNLKSKAKLLLIKGSNYGNSQLNFMEPLYIYDEKGNYTEELNRIYNIYFT